MIETGAVLNLLDRNYANTDLWFPFSQLEVLKNYDIQKLKHLQIEDFRKDKEEFFKKFKQSQNYLENCCFNI